MKSRKLVVMILLTAALLLVGLSTGLLSRSIFLHMGRSLSRMLLGYGISVLLGTATGLLFGLSRYLRMAVKPLLSFFISIPTITWVPLLLVFTGISEKTIVLAIVLGAYFAIVYNVVDGFDSVDRSLVDAARIMGYSKLDLLLRVSLPGSMNKFLVGLKLGIGYSWRALVGAEMLGAASHGLGFLVFASRKFYNLPQMLLALYFIGAFGFFLNRLLIVWVEQKTVLKWGMK